MTLKDRLVEARLVIFVAFLTIGGCQVLPEPPPAHRWTHLVEPRDFLTDEYYETITVEIVALQGAYLPTKEAAQFLSENILAHCRKRSVRVSARLLSASTAPPIWAWMQSNITVVEALNRHNRTEGRDLSLFIIYAPGIFFPIPTIVGLTYATDAFILWGSGLTGVESEKAVLLHELGHILGLVNSGTDSVYDHEDKNHRFHCNGLCVMHHCLGREQPPFFDAACLADLRLGGGR